MKFGIFLFAVSSDPLDDGEVIRKSIEEAVLAEKLGFSAVWLSEHHFDGATAYADPIVFGSAIAARTSSINIGFAVLEMALHHPIRLAVQTALLDQVSQGRLIVGTGRGSAYNEFEYRGFGLTLEQGRMMLAESEELLIKAWTQRPLVHNGNYWNVSFPELRPRPYQLPHPPLVRACIGKESMLAMAKIGRPVLYGVQSTEAIADRLKLYREAMENENFAPEDIEYALDNSWVQKSLMVADTNEHANDIASQGFRRERTHIREGRVKYNPEGNKGGVQLAKPPSEGEQLANAFVVGDVKSVTEQLVALQKAGVRNILFKVDTGGMDFEDVSRSMHLFSREVAPLFTESSLSPS